MHVSPLRRAALAGGIVAGLLVAGASPAAAHGTVVEVDLHCRAAHESTPLDRSCDAAAVYAGDNDPVEDAVLVLRAERVGPGHESVDGIHLAAAGAPGRYAATFLLPAYGTWETLLTVEAPTRGEVRIAQEVLPPSGVAAAPASASIRLVVGFGGRDLVNIAAVVLHLVAATLLLGASGTVLVGRLVAASPARAASPSWPAHWFTPAASGGIAVLAMTGIYMARYDAPTREPGLFQPSAVAGLPFGTAYLVAMAVKLGLAAVVLIGTVRLAVELRREAHSVLAPAAAGAAVSPAASPPAGVGVSAQRSRLATLRGDRVARLALAILVAGGLLLVTVTVADYLHLLTHAGAFVDR